MGDRDDAVDAQQVVGGEVGDVGRNLAGFNRGDYVGGRSLCSTILGGN